MFLAQTIGTMELLIILGIVVLIFGASRLPKLARSVGEASKEFKRGVDSGAADDDVDSNKPN